MSISCAAARNSYKSFVPIVVWEYARGLDIIVRSFLSLFLHSELSDFSPFIYKQLVPLVSATPLTVLHWLLWNFACVFFMVCGCACGLDVTGRLFFTFVPYCELKSFFTLNICSCRQWVIATDKALFSSKNCWYLSYFSMKTYAVELIRSASARHF